ncbi:MAG: MBL fold metallo-hydrolase [Peptococcaceae bacterium]|nr:MBL fold metallo-hydrolase [Peptococcaceae bacterium]
MLEIHRIPVPTPYRVGPVNSYLIKNRPYTLVDPGPETVEARMALTEGLASLGVAPGDIARVVITHSDSDHSGLARWLGEQAGAAVYVHGLEVRKLAFDYDYYRERLPFLREAGLPFKVLKEILEDWDPVAKPVLPRSKVEVVRGGEVLEFSGGSLEVLHLPGHSGGHICLYDPEGGNFLAGDFILKHITPNPIMEADPQNPAKRAPVLAQYLEGLGVLERLDIRVILPGHGKNIYESREAAVRAKEHHARRLELISSILAGKSLSAYQIMRELYPQIRGFQIYLGISEVFAHLDYLLERGALARDGRGGVSFYSSVQP